MLDDVGDDLVLTRAAAPEGGQRGSRGGLEDGRLTTASVTMSNATSTSPTPISPAANPLTAASSTATYLSPIEYADGRHDLRDGTITTITTTTTS